MSLCARCRRPLTREPVVVRGLGYGPVCAAMVGDLATPAPNRTRTTSPVPRRRAGAERQPDLFVEVRP